MNRFFSRKQRSILLWITGGRCAICKNRLTKGFHADHVLAHSLGGKTITKNGQALCAKCNIQKGCK